MGVGQHGIQGITGRKILHHFRRPRPQGAPGGFHKTPDRQGQQFIRAVPDDNILRLAAMQGGQLFPNYFSRGIRIQAQPAVHGRLDRPQDPGRGRIGILIRVQFDQPRDLGLLPRHIRVQLLHEWTDQMVSTTGNHERLV